MTTTTPDAEGRPDAAQSPDAPQGDPAAIGPVADWVRLDDLRRDPFPILERLRREAPVAYVPAAGRWFVTTYADVHATHEDVSTFSADEAGSLMKRSMGHSMLRKDDPEHAVQRASYGGTLKPRAIKETWNAVFDRTFEDVFARFVDLGPGADLVADFAAPYAAENLRVIFGFENASAADMLRWSQTLIDGTGNYADDPDVWEAARRSYEEVDIALDETIERVRREPDASLVSHIVQHADPAVTLEDTRANLKMSIGGGVNEPRDALTNAVFALLSDPAQRDLAVGGARWKDAFEECVRWIAPIGMYPRQMRKDARLGGVDLPAGSKLGICVLSANRDETVWEAPERFDLDRPKVPHQAFGGGEHFCAGAWVARAEVAQIALPRLFERLPGLSLVEDDPAEVSGWVFRGMTRMPVRW